MKGLSPDEILRHSEELRDYAAELLSKLISIKSLSGEEEQIIRFLEKEFTRSGADEVWVDGFGNIIAKVGRGTPAIAYDAHVDTVHAGREDLWEFDPFSGEIKGNKICGRGAADQKAGMAAMITALRILSGVKPDLPCTIYFVGSVLEEDCDGLCWQYIVKEEKLKPDVVILTEPTDGNINRGHRGRMEIEIVVDGVSCHGSAPERGENAIYKMAPIISALEELNSRLPTDSFLGKGSLAVSRVSSSSPSLCAVADEAAAYIDRRLTNNESPSQAKSQLEALAEVKTAGAMVNIPEFRDPSWRGTVYPTAKTYPTWILPENSQYLLNARKCYSTLFNKEPILGKWTFSTNGVATMGLFNIPTLGFGPGKESMAHAPNENVEIDELCRCAAFYACYPFLLKGGFGAQE